jgi:ubiquinone/menaquinone biosynthesis C-methylase UbiE
VARLFATTYDLCQWPAEQLGFRALRRRAVADLSGRVLELGAGTGLNFPFYQAATEVVAVEPDPDMRARAVGRARVAHVPIRLVDAPAEQLPFADHSFDAAAITLVLCSVSDVTQSLAELRRVLHPGAPVHLVEHVRAPQAPIAALQTALTPLQRRIAGNCHLDRRTADALRAADFTIEHARPHVGGILLELAARAPR